MIYASFSPFRKGGFEKDKEKSTLALLYERRGFKSLESYQWTNPFLYLDITGCETPSYFFVPGSVIDQGSNNCFSFSAGSTFFSSATCLTVFPVS